jgi:hypothetical protein
MTVDSNKFDRLSITKKAKQVLKVSLADVYNMALREQFWEALSGGKRKVGFIRFNRHDVFKFINNNLQASPLCLTGI